MRVQFLAALSDRMNSGNNEARLCRQLQRWMSEVEPKNRVFFWRRTNSHREPRQPLESYFVGFVGSVRGAWVTEGRFMNILLFFDWSSVCLGRNHLPARCAGFEVCPSVMITHEHISRPRRLITISRTAADHAPFQRLWASVFVSRLYAASASRYQFTVSQSGRGGCF